MAFQLTAKESVGDGITRNVKHELEKVVDLAGAKRKDRDTESEAVHEIRKCFKKVRAALRLVRDELGDDVYREENCGFRDAARPLTGVRDVEMLVETFDKLAPQLGAIDQKTIAKMRAALLANQQEVTRRVLDDDRALAGVKDAAVRALARVTEWRIDGDGWAAIDGGLRRVYRAGHRALALATKDPSVDNLHEWRKQSKYLWHQLQLLESTWRGAEPALGDRVHELSSLLGDDHDLAVLRETFAADPLAYGGHGVLKTMFAVVDRERAELERRAFALGHELYTDPPKIFASRIEAYWKPWTERKHARIGAAG